VIEVLRRPPEFALGALVGVNHGSAEGVALGDGHPEGVGDERGVRACVDRPTDHSSGEHVEHHRAVDLALAGRMLGDVGDPEPVRFGPCEVPSDEVAGGGLVGDAPVPRPAAEALQARLPHQEPHRLLTDRQAVAQGQLRVHASVAVHAAEVDVHLLDEIGEPRMADRSLRRRARAPRIEPGLGHVEDSARQLRGETLGDHHLDGREPPFGSARSLSSSVARR
jgi:hypothetical protein